MGKLAAVTHGPTAVKRLLAVIFVVAWNACTTLALAAEPPPAPAPPQQILMAPSAGSDLPDLGSPAETILSHRDEYGLGAMVAKELRDQNALIDDPEVYEYINGVGQRLAAQSSEGGNGFEYNDIKDTDARDTARFHSDGAPSYYKLHKPTERRCVVTATGFGSEMSGCLGTDSQRVSKIMAYRCNTDFT